MIITLSDMRSLGCPFNSQRIGLSTFGTLPIWLFCFSFKVALLKTLFLLSLSVSDDVRLFRAKMDVLSIEFLTGSIVV